VLLVHSILEVRHTTPLTGREEDVLRGRCQAATQAESSAFLLTNAHLCDKVPRSLNMFEWTLITE
jgi:hypothetical protein